MKNPPNLGEPFDKENAFLLYSIFCGDAKRTAHALNVSDSLIEQLAVENKWDRQLKPIIDLKQSSRAGDVERAINRAINFVQAHKTRLLLERVLIKLTGMTPSDLEAFLFPQRTKQGDVVQTFSTRALADLASAIEKCHAMTYLALNDTASDRKERGEDASDAQGGASASEIHIRLAEAMANAGGASKSVKGLVLDAQLEMAQERAAVELTQSLPK